MKFQKNDIWTRRERDTRQAVWISEAFLVNAIKGLTELNLRVKYRQRYLKTVNGSKRKKQAILPDTEATFRYARKHGTFYYDYDRLPDNRRKHLPSKEELVELYEQAMNNNSQSAMERDLLDHLKDLTKYLPAYGSCTEIQAKHLARACAVVQFAANDLRGSEPQWSNDYYRNLSAVIKRHNWPYLPKNYRRLKEKIDRVIDGADVRKVIKLPRRGNSNAKQYDDKQVIGWLMYLRSRPENYSNAHIARKIMKMCVLAGKPVPSQSWIEHFFADAKTKFLTGPFRYGSARKGAEYKSYLPVAGALYAGDCWQMDGTRFNFIPHKTEDGSEKSMIIIVVRDVHSGDIIGFHLDTKEDRYGYLNALNMAVSNTGHLPYELVHDRFPGHNTDEWTLLSRRLEHKGVKISVTSTGTGKSHVERCFETLQDVFMIDSKWYYGHGVQSTRDAAHRSPEYLARVRKQARKEGFDFDAAWHAAAQIVGNYRKTPLSEYSRKHAAVPESPMELYQKSEQLNVIKIDDFERVMLFGTCRSATIRNNGLIRMRIHKAEYCYRIEDYNIIVNYKKVVLYYDLEDLSRVHLFAPGDDLNAPYLGEAIEEEALQYYGPNAEFDRMAKMKEARKEVHEKRKAELEELTADVADEVDLLLGAIASKTDNDAAQTNWLEERVETWVDRGESRRIVLPEVPEEDDENDDDLLSRVIRNY
jgi:hypothetical protein